MYFFIDFFVISLGKFLFLSIFFSDFTLLHVFFCTFLSKISIEFYFL